MSVDIDIMEFHKDLDGSRNRGKGEKKRRQAMPAMMRRSGASKQRKTKKECKAQWMV